MKLTLVDHSWKTEENEVLTRDVFEIGSYTVKRICHFNQKNELIFKNYSITTDMSKKYVPEIYYEEKMGIVNGSIVRNESFEIQTTAYGPKSAEEIEKIIAGYQEAVEVVRILNKEFC